MAENNFTFTGVVIEEAKSYTSLCLELDVASQGETVQAAKEGLAEAAALYLESAIESNLPFIRAVPLDQDPRRVTPDQVVETFPLRVNIAISAYA